MSDQDMESMTALARAIQRLTWANMVRISEHIANEIPHLQKSERLDRDGIAQIIHEMATDILSEAKREKTATVIDNGGSK